MKAVEELKRYNLLKQIGKGTFGKVFLTVKDNYPGLLATKVIDISKIKNDKKTLDYLNREEEIMKELDHPNIIKLNNFIEFNEHYFFIMEYCNGGTLSDLLKKYLKKYRKPFTLEIIQYYMRQIVEGLKYIHSKDIIHRDLKLSNILVHFKNIRGKDKVDTVDFNNLDDKDLLNSTIKIIDFGLSFILKKPDDLAKSVVGTPFNMDPLVLKKYYQEEKAKYSNGNPYNKGPLILKKYQKAGGYENDLGYSKEVDIWSLGTICYQMLTGDPLFSAETVDDLVIKVEEGNYSIPFDIEISNEIISFLNSMLQYNGKFRPSIEDLSKNVFLKGDAKLFTKIDYQKQPNAYIIINNMKNSIYINILRKK
jgi:serine/threonine protein kinase